MTKVFGHRGYSEKYPENTLLAFEKAIEAGADGMEFDVHLTKDQVLVIIHDEKIDRTTNGKGYIKDLTYDELCKYDASYIFSQYGFQKIPTLREYFELVKDTDIISNIELKTHIIWYDGIEKAVLDLINEYNLKEKVIISSFNHRSVMKMKSLCNDIKLAFLEESWVYDMGAYTKRLGVDCVHPYGPSLSVESVNEYKENGCEINGWDINTENEIKKAIELGIDGIITNYIERARKIVG